MEKLYVDTNVFISYWDAEYGRKISDAFECYAGDLFERALSCEFQICVSERVVYELEKKMGKARVGRLIEPFKQKGKWSLLETNSNIWSRARKVNEEYGIHFADAFHTAVAEFFNVPLVTWNLKDFEKVSTLDLRTPKDL